MKKKLKRYILRLDPENGYIVNTISIVENPAMKKDFVALADQQVKFATVDEEKRELIGVVLEPNKPIYRNDGEEEYEIVLPEDVVKQSLLSFMKNGKQNNSNINHKPSLKLEGVTFYENWIVEDEKNDKSNIYNLNAKKGSWVANMKLESEDVWNDYVKTGKVKGFSIEGDFIHEEIKLNNDMSNKVELNEDSKSWFESLLKSVFNSKADPVALKEDEVKLEEKEEDKKEEETEMEVAGLTDEMKTEIMEMIKEVVSGMTTEMEKKDEKKEVAMKAEIKSLKEKVVELGKKPASKAVKSAPTAPSANESMVDFLNRVTQ